MTVKRVLHYPDGKLIDEVVADGYMHLERMTGTEYWIGLEGPGGEQVALWITSERPIEVRGGINGEESGVWPEGVEVEYHATGLLEGDQGEDLEGSAEILRGAGERWRQIREADPQAVDRSIEAAARAEGDIEDELEAEAVVERKEGPDQGHRVRRSAWLESEEVTQSDDLETHVCDAFRVAHPRDEESLSPSPRERGEAIDHIVYRNGVWWAVSGSATAEYSSPIRYCPWCGAHLDPGTS